MKVHNAEPDNPVPQPAARAVSASMLTQSCHGWYRHYNCCCCRCWCGGCVCRCPSAPAAAAVQGATPALTTAPAFCAAGPSFLLMEPPALNRAMSTPSKLQDRHKHTQQQCMSALGSAMRDRNHSSLLVQGQARPLSSCLLRLLGGTGGRLAAAEAAHCVPWRLHRPAAVGEAAGPCCSIVCRLQFALLTPSPVLSQLLNGVLDTLKLLLLASRPAAWSDFVCSSCCPMRTPACPVSLHTHLLLASSLMLL